MIFITNKVIDSTITKAFFLLWELSDISYAQHVAFKRDWTSQYCALMCLN